MSNLYGTMLSDVSKAKTSQGNKEMSCKINTWDTGVLLQVARDENNRLHLELFKTKGSNGSSKDKQLLYQDIIP